LSEQPTGHARSGAPATDFAANISWYRMDLRRKGLLADTPSARRRAKKTAQAQCDYRLAQLATDGVVAPLWVERDANLKFVVVHGRLPQAVLDRYLDSRERDDDGDEDEVIATQSARATRIYY
jgi:hypothetical protein